MKKTLSNIIIMAMDILLLIFLFYIAQYIRVSLETSYIPAFKQLTLSDFSFFIIIVLISIAIFFLLVGKTEEALIKDVLKVDK